MTEPENQTPTPVPTPTSEPQSTPVISNVVDEVSKLNNVEVHGGDTVRYNGVDYRISGYVDIGNGEKVITLTDYDPSKYASYGSNMKASGYYSSKEYYIDANETLQELDRKQVDQNYRSENDTIVMNGKEYSWNSTWKPVSDESESFEVASTSVSAKAVNNEYSAMAYSGGTVTGGDVHSINNEEYTVLGYATPLDDVSSETKRRIIYYKDGEYYARDMNGTLQKINPPGGLSDTTTIDGQEYFYTQAVNGNRTTSFEPCEIDKKALKNDSANDSQKTEPPTTTAPTDTRTVFGINYAYNKSSTLSNEQYNLNDFLTEKRKKYYVTYYDRTWWTSKYYIAEEARDLVINVFNLTPGQGKGASADAERLGQLIGSIRKALEEIEVLEKDGMYEKGRCLGATETEAIIENLDTIVPETYRRFTKEWNIYRAAEYSNRMQEQSNKSAYDSAVRKKQEVLYTFTSSEQYNEDEIDALRSTLAVKSETIDEDINSRYSCYLSGNEYTGGASASIISSRSTPEGVGTGSKDELYINPTNVDKIIECLKVIINNYVLQVNQLIEYMVDRINKIDHYVAECGMLRKDGATKYSGINGKGLELRDDLKDLLNKFIEWKKLHIGYFSEDTEVPTTPVPPPGPTTPPTTPQPGPTTPPTTPKTEPTTPPTTPKTEPITERPTETITQPNTETPTDTVQQRTTEPPSPPISGQSHGGSISGGNGGGAYYYGNDTSTTTSEVPTQLPVDDDVIKKGNTYKLPTSSKPIQTTTQTSGKGSSIIPVLAGLGAAAAAGIGAKTYLDRKKNTDNDEEEEFKAEDWSGNNEINIEYQEPTSEKEETLDFDDDGYATEEPEKYGAKTNQELENLQ